MGRRSAPRPSRQRRLRRSRRGAWRTRLPQRNGPRFRTSSEIEIAWADDPGDRGAIWPWGLVAIAWQAGSGWDASMAAEASSTPKYRFEVNGLVRLSQA